MPDGDEAALTAISLVAPSRAPAQAHAGHAAGVAQTSSSVATGEAASCRQRPWRAACHEDGLGAELVATVDQVHLARDVGQVERLLDRGVAAADDADLLAAVEEAVAGGAAADPRPMKACSEGSPRYFGARAGGDDERVAGVATAVARERERPARGPPC